MAGRKAFRSGMMRRSSALVTSSKLWKSRLVFWAGALATGVISAAFALMADDAQDLFHFVTQGDGWQMWLPLLIPPLGMVICALAADRFSPDRRGLAFRKPLQRGIYAMTSSAVICYRSGWWLARSC